jgi:hypothetical protein
MQQKPLPEPRDEEHSAIYDLSNLSRQDALKKLGIVELPTKSITEALRNMSDAIENRVAIKALGVKLDDAQRLVHEAQKDAGHPDPALLSLAKDMYSEISDALEGLGEGEAAQKARDVAIPLGKWLKNALHIQLKTVYGAATEMERHPGNKTFVTAAKNELIKLAPLQDEESRQNTIGMIKELEVLEKRLDKPAPKKS